jgi:hypothetical protein
VVILHVVWSVSVPIGLVEAVFSERRTVPWLGNIGFVINFIAFIIGTALVTFGTWSNEHFTATVSQLGVTSLIAAMCVVSAFALFAPHKTSLAATSEQPSRKWHPVLFFLLALVTGSAFHLLPQFGSDYIAPPAQVALALLLPMIVIVPVSLASRSGEWTTAHTDALALGGVLTYCWLGFLMVYRLHGPKAIPGQIVPVSIVLAVIYFGIVRKKRSAKA